jgi:hypothetical protein
MPAGPLFELAVIRVQRNRRAPQWPGRGDGRGTGRATQTGLPWIARVPDVVLTHDPDREHPSAFCAGCVE